MLRKLGVMLGAGVVLLGVGAPAVSAGAAARTATVTDVLPFYYGYFLTEGSAVAHPQVATSTVVVAATCEVTAVSATTPNSTTRTGCYILDVATGARHYLFSTRSGLTGGSGAGTFTLPAKHDYKLCVWAMHNESFSPLVTDAPCALLR